MARIKKNLELGKGQLMFLDSAIRRWLKLPEAKGFKKVGSAAIVSPWHEGPRVSLELDDERFLFYFKKRTIGYNVIAVWTVKPRERIWPVGNQAHTYNKKVWCSICGCACRETINSSPDDINSSPGDASR